MESEENIEILRTAYKKYKIILYIWQEKDDYLDVEEDERQEAWDAEEEFHNVCKTIPSLTPLCEKEAQLARKINELDLETRELENEFRVLRKTKTALIKSLIKEDTDGEIHSTVTKDSGSGES